MLADNAPAAEGVENCALLLGAFVEPKIYAPLLIEEMMDVTTDVPFRLGRATLLAFLIRGAGGILRMRAFLLGLCASLGFLSQPTLGRACRLAINPYKKVKSGGGVAE